MGEVLPEGEAPDELVVDRVEDGVSGEVEQEPDRDGRPAELGDPRDGEAARGRLQELWE
jgi:hypothetical protein